MAYPMYSNIKDKNTGKRLVYEEVVAKYIMAAATNTDIKDITESDKPDLVIGNVGIEVVSAVPNEFNYLMALRAEQDRHGENNAAKIEKCAKEISAKVAPYGIFNKPIYIIDGVTKVQETPYATILSVYKKKIEKLNKGEYQKKDEYRLFVYTEYYLENEWMCSEIVKELSKLSEGKPIQYTHVYVYVCNEFIDFDLQAETFAITSIEGNALVNSAWEEIESRMSLENLIQRYCPDGVVYKSLSIAADMKRGTSLTKQNAVEGNIPVISGGREPAFYHNVSNRVGAVITVAGSGAGAGYVQYFETPIFANDCFTLQGKKGVLTKYVYYCLSNMQERISATKKGGGVPHVHISDIEDFEIPVPPLPVQKEIVRMYYKDNNDIKYIDKDGNELRLKPVTDNADLHIRMKAVPVEYRVARFCYTVTRSFTPTFYRLLFALRLISSCLRSS